MFYGNLNISKNKATSLWSFVANYFARARQRWTDASVVNKAQPSLGEHATHCLPGARRSISSHHMLHTTVESVPLICYNIDMSVTLGVLYKSDIQGVAIKDPN